MKTVSALLLSLCLTTAVNAAQVVSVGDGDTIRVSEGSSRITVRLACIDAPETSQRPWVQGQRITEAANTRWLRGDIEVKQRPLRKTVAELLTRRGNVNQLMVEAGQAFAYRRYLRQCDSQRYLQLENEAQRQGIESGPLAVRHRTALGLSARETQQFIKLSTSRKYRCTDIDLESRSRAWLRDTVTSMVTRWRSRNAQVTIYEQWCAAKPD